MKHYYRLFTALACFFALTNISKGQTTVPSIISSNQTWDASGSPYMVTANVLVEKGAKVTVMPGAIIKGSESLKILVDGEFVANGKKDSIVTFDTVILEFTSQSKGYDFSTKTGSNFSYCLFNGTGMGGSRTIYLNQISLLISNCKFYNTYYTIYGVNANTDTCKVRIEKSVFEGGKYPGYVIYAMGRYAFIEIDECYVNHTYGMFLTNYTSITRSTFRNWVSWGGFRINSISSSYPSEIIISCNSFSRFQNSVIEMFGLPTSNKVTITNNTFDSAVYFIDLSLNTGTNKTLSVLIENNNFLNFTKKSVLVKGGNNPGKADTLNFRNNYWGTTSSSSIAAGINDFNDDVLVAGVVDYGNYHNSKQTTCSTQNPGGTNAIVKVVATEFNLMPNPATTMVKITVPASGSKTISVRDLSGKVVYSTKAEGNEFAVDCNHLSNGMYVVEVGVEGLSIQAKKLLITK